MNRLTERDEYGNADIIGVDSEDLQLNLDFEGFNRVTEALNRLASYEDTGLEPEQCAKYAQAEKEGRYILLKEPGTAGIHRLEEIARADIKGRLVVLPPCKEGDTVWAFGYLPTSSRYVIYCAEVKEFRVRENHYGRDISVLLEPVDFRGRRKEYGAADFGKTVFLTREDAEKALGGMNNDER